MNPITSLFNRILPSVTFIPGPYRLEPFQASVAILGGILLVFPWSSAAPYAVLCTPELLTCHSVSLLTALFSR